MKKNGILVAILLLAFFGGVIGELFSPGNPFPASMFPVMFVGAALSFWWYRSDSNDIEYKRGKMLNIGIVALGIVAFPYYFFRSRGFLKGLKYTFAFICLMVLWSVLDVIGATIVVVSKQS